MGKRLTFWLLAVYGATVSQRSPACPARHCPRFKPLETTVPVYDPHGWHQDGDPRTVRKSTSPRADERTVKLYVPGGRGSGALWS